MLTAILVTAVLVTEPMSILAEDGSLAVLYQLYNYKMS
jgi:hypothetical protein